MKISVGDKLESEVKYPFYAVLACLFSLSQLMAGRFGTFKTATVLMLMDPLVPKFQNVRYER